MPGADHPVSMRPLRRADCSLLGEWFAMPHVAPWWCEPYDLRSIEARYGRSIDGGDPTEVFIVESGEVPVGLVQRYLIEDDPEWKQSLSPAGAPVGSAGIDYLIGVETCTGRGLGPRIIDHLVRDTWRRYPTVPAAVAGVQQQNRRSWRALEKCGFERVWAGLLESDDPSDAGPSYVYVRHRHRHRHRP